MKTGIKVAIVEDNYEICEEVRLLISRTPDLSCCGVARNAASALEILPSAKPDVVLMDVRLPGGSGVECVRELKPLLPKAQIIMFTVSDDTAVIMNALKAGAIGYLLKNSSADEITSGIRRAFQREAPLTPEVARKLVENLHRESQPPQRSAQLTSRENEVVALLAQGLSDKQIADRLMITLLTVNSHLKNIYAKLNVHSRVEVAMKFVQLQQANAVAPRESMPDMPDSRDGNLRR